MGKDADTQYKMPFAELLPPLAENDLRALEADIQERGIKLPIEVDPQGNVLDGHHRYKIGLERKAKDESFKIPTRIVRDAKTDDEKRAHAIRVNLLRRNLSQEQRRDLLKKQQAIARRLRESDPKLWTQAEVAKVLGVAHQTVSVWFGTNSSDGITSAPILDARVKVPPKKRPDVAERVDKVGARQAAADYGISERQARSIATREKKAEEKKKARQERATDDAIEGIEIHHGDFRELGDCVADGSVDLIFTDPPYDRESIPLYADLAAYAARKLKPGGWCLAYSGHAHLPEVFVACAGALTYGWTFAVRHKDANLRFRNVKIHNGWKPILGFYRPPLDAWWDWMTDIVSGGKEKDEHEWQQAEAEATHFIDAMSPDGGLIVDPFIGGGTTALAAHRTGRRCVGFEIKAETVRAARKRLSDHKKTKRG